MNEKEDENNFVPKFVKELELEKESESESSTKNSNKSKKSPKKNEVEEIQQYLSQFGYLEIPDEELDVVDKFSLTRELAEIPTVEKGVLDEATIGALKEFQRFNNIPVTGNIDEATTELLEKPRCGFPDAIAEFTNTGRKWPSNHLTYAFQEFSPDIPQGQITQGIEQAFALWSAVTPLCFRRVAINRSPDIVIRFVRRDHGDGFPFDGPGAVLAHAFFPPVPPNPPQPIQGDMHFDEDETWTIAIPPHSGRFDLVTVAAHEIGHALGLGHSSVAGSLMAPSYSGPHRFLHSDDIAGITQIYGGYPIAFASWTHGTSIQIEHPDRIQTLRRFGFFTRIIGQPNTTNWFHFAIPTPVIIDNDRKTIGPIILRFRTRSNNAVVRDVHIYDGERRLIAHNDVNLSGSHLFERFGVPHCPPVLWGVGVSIGVRFGDGSANERIMDFIAAGCDFKQ